MSGPTYKISHKGVDKALEDAKSDLVKYDLFIGKHSILRTLCEEDTDFLDHFDRYMKSEFTLLGHIQRSDPVSKPLDSAMIAWWHNCEQRCIGHSNLAFITCMTIIHWLLTDQRTFSDIVSKNAATTISKSLQT